MPKLDKWHFLKTKVSWIVIAILVLPMAIFAFWQPSRGGSAGVIFGTPIAWEEFQDAYRQVRRQRENQLSQLPEALRAQLTPSDDQLAQMAWDRLILEQEAKRRRIRVTDQELLDILTQDPSFQTKGAFDRLLYHRVLRAMNNSPELYEQQLRQQLAMKKLVDSVVNAVAVSDEELKAAYRAEHEQLRAIVWYVDASSLTASASAALKDEEVRASYDAHPEAFRIPERLSLEYAGASREELAKHITPEEAALKTFYDIHADEFKKAGGTPQSFDEAKEAVRNRLAKIEIDKRLNALAIDLQEDVKAKRAFEEIVTQRQLAMKTAGPVSADGVWAMGGPEPAVLEQAQKLKTGEMSGVIETENGVWIARVTQRQASRVPPLEEVRQKIREQLTQERAKAEARKTAEAWLARVKAKRAAGWRYEEILATDPSPVAPTTSTFTRGGDIIPIGHSAQITGTAFATALGELTPVMETSGGVVVLRPEERLPADEAKFAETEKTLREEQLTRKKNEQVEAWLADLRTQAKLKSFVAGTRG